MPEPESTSIFTTRLAPVSWHSKKSPYTHQVISSSDRVVCLAGETQAGLIADVLTIYFNPNPDHYPERKS